MNTRACEETNDAKRCNTSRLLRSRSNIVCVSPKNFEIYSLECVKFVSERYEYDDIPWISERLKKTMAPKDAAHHTCLHHVQKSYPHRRIIFLFVPLGSGCTECSNACEITSFPYTCGRRAVQEQPRTAACSDHAYCSRCRSTRWCSRRRLHDLRPSGAPPLSGWNRTSALSWNICLRSEHWWNIACFILSDAQIIWNFAVPGNGVCGRCRGPSAHRGKGAGACERVYITCFQRL